MVGNGDGDMPSYHAPSVVIPDHHAPSRTSGFLRYWSTRYRAITCFFLVIWSAPTLALAFFVGLSSPSAALPIWHKIRYQYDSEISSKHSKCELLFTYTSSCSNHVLFQKSSWVEYFWKCKVVGCNVERGHGRQRCLKLLHTQQVCVRTRHLVVTRLRWADSWRSTEELD